MDDPVVVNNVFRCKVPGCPGNMIINFPAEVKLIGCPRCGVFNCRNCNAVHTGMTCKLYNERRGVNVPALPQQIIAPIIQRPAMNEPRQVVIPVRRIPEQAAVIPQPAVPIPQQIVIPQPRANVPAPQRMQPNVQDGIHFNCKNGTCPGYLNLRNIENIKLIGCPVCGIFNCYPCKAIHTGMNCKQYRARMGIPEDEITLNPLPFPNQKANIGSLHKAVIAKPYLTIDELRAVDDLNLILTSENFDCPVCMDIILPGNGAIIRSCGHECCKNCLADMVSNNDRAVIPCVTPGCIGTLQDREIRELVTTEIFDKYIQRSLFEAQKCIPGLFMCRTPDCNGMWCVDEDNNLPNYRCDICKKLNCHKCKAVHENMTCVIYQDNYANQKDPNVLANLKAIQEKLDKGEIMYCPGCKAMVERDDGCSWIMCAMCKTEICWATRGPRWGPKGANDTSGGCKCDWKNGNKCHPDCNYCH